MPIPEKNCHLPEHHGEHVVTHIPLITLPLLLLLVFLLDEHLNFSFHIFYFDFLFYTRLTKTR